MGLRAAGFVGLVSALASCGMTIPRAELDRCELGKADRNETYAARQGAACATIARRYTAADRSGDAMSYARKACELQDARGCELYIAIVRGHPSLAAEELPRARAAGEKGCSGLVIADDGVDARPALCARTAELYLDLEPRSREDAGRLFARACKLGDSRGCARAEELGVTGAALVPSSESGHAAQRPSSGPASSAPASSRAPATALAGDGGAVPAAPLVACHPMRSCVSLAVQQRNTSEVFGSIRNQCDRKVTCTWCPARGDRVDKGQCRSATLQSGEAKADRESGLWYDGYDAIAYDCVDARDDRGCLGL